MGFLGFTVLYGVGLATLWVVVLWVGCAGKASAMASPCWFCRASPCSASGGFLVFTMLVVIRLGYGFFGFRRALWCWVGCVGLTVLWVDCVGEALAMERQR